MELSSAAEEHWSDGALDVRLSSTAKPILVIASSIHLFRSGVLAICINKIVSKIRPVSRTFRQRH